MKKTKIICTIGPSSETKETLKELLKSGMNMMRLNFSHGNYEEHKEKIDNFRAAQAETGIRAALMLDIKGPKIRTTKLKDGKNVNIVSGQEFIITTDKSVIGDEKMVAVTYEDIIQDVKVGEKLLIDDGLLQFSIKEITGNKIICIALNNGELGENKGVNLPKAKVSLPAISEKDKNDLIFGCQQGVDYVAASFIRKADDVKDVRKVLDENGGKNILIISKIETQEGIDNFDEILKVSDGIMVARGDLGVEIPIEDVPIAQKMMIEKCNAAGKVVITATQMLDSMIKNPRPTRAEVNDVANAILDGTDCIMLSGESANGKYPVEAVRVMTRISEKIDPLVSKKNYFTEDMTITTAVTKGTAEISESLNTKVIVVATQSGRAARDMRRYFPKAEILAITNNEKTANQLLIVRGITPFIDGQPENLDSFFQLAEKVSVDLKLAKKDDVIIANCGESIFKVGTTNSIKLIKIS
ncbi:pyruvate kinase PykF [Fusobacterium varium]|mgnify:FL=1|uniref:Pyruvate kinase n=1 Tax=Fusobacterium varium ATCC 27725 TaxID=469618 RepID=A0ABM6U6A4_FUSVA|nr:pyruvate kinase PykF [Fusobacterium varium]AVQ31881.1 pyruvate kinase PykF [Fusobacterium varium ATCC 27725]EES63236.1 pyruvate kinase [Fusobacterium varium ATCC 27725]MCF0171462.1 pyruvate kinase PykF [Fusobacterium varium]MCI6034218.1 pyruvate kinase PykF [Fusobacterium varium]RGJ28615.1 pyruvate kinase PykF [Fusobacterium varium]